MFFEKRIIKNLKMESSHIVSVDFSLDSELKKKIIEGFGKASNLPMIRIEKDGERMILLNSHVDTYDTLLVYLTSLDKLPLCVIKDMYKSYLKRYRALTTANLQVQDLEETCRRITFVLSIEILWCNGSDIKSRIFN